MIEELNGTQKLVGNERAVTYDRRNLKADG